MGIFLIYNCTVIFRLDESNVWLYDEYKRAYAEILHRWKLLDARAQVKYYYTVNILLNFFVIF